MKDRFAVPFIALVISLSSLFVVSSALYAQDTSNDCKAIDENDSTESVLTKRLVCYNSELDGLTLLMGKLLKEREQLSVLLDEESSAALAGTETDSNTLNEQLETIEQLRLERSELSAQLHQELIDKHEQLLSKEAEDRLLRNYSEAYLAIADENAELIARVKSLNEQLVALTDDRDKLTSESQSLNNNIQSLNNDITTYKATVADLSAHRTRLAQELENSILLSEKMKKQLLLNAELSQQQAKRAASLESDKQNTGIELNRLYNELATSKKSHADDLHAATDQQQILAARLDALTEENTALANAAQQAAATAKEELAAKEQTIDILNDEVLGLKDERIAVSTQLDNADKLLAEKKDIIATLTNESEKYKADNKALTETLAAKDTELEQISQQLQSVTAEKDESTSRIASLQQQIEESQNTVSELQGENTTASEAIDQLNTEKADLVKSLDDLQSQHDELAENLTTTNAELETASVDNKAASSEIETLKEKNAKLQNELSGTKSALTAADSEMLERQYKLAALQASNKKAEDKVVTLNDQVASLQNLLDESQNNNETVAESLAAIKTELHASNQRLSDQKSELNQLLKEKESIVKALNKVKSDTDTLAGAIGQEMTNPDVQIEVRPDNTIGMQIASSQLFRTGSSVLSDEGKLLLGEVAATLKKSSSRRILIEGHSDNVPLGPKLSRIFTDNMGLSMARATSAATFFAREAGLPPQQLSISGAGDTRPVASNDTVEGRQQNRRVEIMLLPLDSGSGQ